MSIKYNLRHSIVSNMPILLASVVVFIIMSFVSPYFCTFLNLEVVAMGFIQEAIMALGMTVIIIAGGIDLSVGALLGCTAAIVGLLLTAHVNVFFAVVATLAIATLIGFINGFMINKLRAHPFIVTLVTMTLLQGITFVLTQGGTIAGFPEEFSFFGQGRVLGFPFPILLYFILALSLGLLLQKNRFLHNAYFIGSNPQAAHLCGIKVNRFRIITYGLSAFLAGIAGIITASQYISASPGFGLNAELRVITAVFIGGASLSGGRGTIGRTVLGSLLLALINNAFVQANLPTYWEKVSYGSLLLIAVLVDQYTVHKRSPSRVSWRDILASGGGTG